MSTVIQRDAENADDLYVWWDGATLGAGAQVVCGADEVAAFYDGTKVLAVIGSGRTTLTSAAYPALAPYLERHLFSAQPELAICFITTREWEGWEVEADVGRMPGPDGLVRQISSWATLTLKVNPPATFAEQLLHAEETASEAEGGDEGDDTEVGDDTIDESANEGAEGDEDEEDDDGEPNPIDFFLEKALRSAIAKVLVDENPGLAEMTATVSAQLPELLTKELKWFGLEVVSVGELQLFRDDEQVS